MKQLCLRSLSTGLVRQQNLSPRDRHYISAVECGKQKVMCELLKPFAVQAKH